MQRAHVSNAQPSPAPQGSGGINRAEHRQKPSLLLVSFDGFRADYLDRFDLPNFRRVMARGTRARGMHPVFPTITFPNHYSLVTGLYPEHHGIVENSFFDPVRNDAFSFRNFQTVSDGTWFGGEPIWVTAERQGMVSACFFWPGSEADIKGIRPTYWNRYDGSVPNEQRIETVLGWLRLPADRRPHVITLYFSDVDSASHRTAIGGSDVAAAVAAVDTALGMLLDGLDRLENRDRVLLMLTSDHGMADTGSRANRAARRCDRHDRRARGLQRPGDRRCTSLRRPGRRRPSAIGSTRNCSTAGPTCVRKCRNATISATRRAPATSS